MLEQLADFAADHFPAPHAVALPDPAGHADPAGHEFCVALVDPAGQ